jgi:hypothetical protein
VPEVIAKLRDEVKDFSKQFVTIGFSKDSMRYKE